MYLPELHRLACKEQKHSEAYVAGIAKKFDELVFDLIRYETKDKIY